MIFKVFLSKRERQILAAAELNRSNMKLTKKYLKNDVTFNISFICSREPCFDSSHLFVNL